jgi:hypothetical protein
MCVRDILVLAIVLNAGSALRAQLPSVPDSTQAGRFALVLYTGGGIAYYPQLPPTPSHLATRSTSNGPGFTARIMWLSDHRLRVGIESGWITFYSYDIVEPAQPGRLELTGVPLLLMWSMPITQRFSLFAGYGTYRITSRLDYITRTEASMFSLGYAAALSYVYPFSERIGAAMEVKWYNAAETRHTILSAQVQLVWKLHSW